MHAIEDSAACAKTSNLGEDRRCAAVMKHVGPLPTRPPLHVLRLMSCPRTDWASCGRNMSDASAARIDVRIAYVTSGLGLSVAKPVVCELLQSSVTPRKVPI